MSTNGTRHFLDLIDIPPQELRGMIDASRAMKARRKSGASAPQSKALEGKTLAMIFDKPSTRTRVSFDVAMRQLGGEAILLTGQEMQLGRGETIADTARVLSRYVDIIMIRTLDHETVTELARYATVPVINGLTRRSHPCQVLADVLTFEEHRGPIRGKTVAWTGDANNVLASWMHAAERFEFRRRRDIELELEAFGGMGPGRQHIVVVTGPGHGAALDRPAVLLERHQVSHHLAGMRAPRQPVDHRHGGVGCKLQQRVMIEDADHDGVDIARQHAGGIGDGLAAAKLHLRAGQHDRLAAELAHADVERHSRAGRGTLENHRQRLAFERLLALLMRLQLRLHGSAGGEHVAQLVQWQLADIEEVTNRLAHHPAAFFNPPAESALQARSRH